MRLPWTSLVLVLAGCLAGCSDPVEGDWQSDSELGNGRRNELSVFGDGTAEATIFATPKNEPAVWHRFEFDADWEKNDTEFDFKMDCNVGPCNGDDFDMECKVIKDEADDDAEKLDCTAHDKWAAYPFDWERNE